MSHGTEAPAETVSAIDGHGARVQSMFTRIAHGYDRANRWMSLGTDVRWRRQAVAGSVPDPPHASGAVPRVLDLCAGTLDSTLEIHRQYPDADVIAADFSRGMLSRGRAKLTGPAAARIETLQLDAHALPFTDDSLDAVFCAFGVRNLSDVPRATTEQARCLRPGGTLTVLEFFRPEGVVTRTFHSVYNRTLLPLVGWAATGDLDAYRYLPRSIGAFDRVDRYRALLESCGFEPVSVARLTFGIAWVVRATLREGGP